MKRELISHFLRDPFFATKVNFESAGDIICIIQPASNDDLQILPEGDRYNPTVRIFSRTRLTNGMLFQHHNMRFRIISESIWSDYGYYDCLATRYDGSQAHDSGGFDVT
ncbi:hypothetical protein A9G34_01005 [Gilliamella sp. Choc4-2]|nr:hypothetical protein A9G34_01005 [Gilliamella apicola]